MSERSAVHLHIDHVNFSYTPEHGSLIDDLSITFATGWSGIVGANGIGKSTLLKRATGFLRPDDGSIGPAALTANAIYCPQDMPEPPEELFDLLGSTDADSTRLINTLGVQYEWPYRWETLSMGERKRAQVAAAIARTPTVLALDEPDNHLDRSARAAILAALQDFTGIGLVVGHNRDFLDALCDRTVFVRGPNRIVVRPGGVSAGLREEEREEEAGRREWIVHARTVRRLTREADRRSAIASQQDARRSRRHLDRKDSDGRARIGLAIFTGKDGRAGRLKAQIDRRIESARVSMDTSQPHRSRKRGISIPSHVSHRDRLVDLPEQKITLGGDRIFNLPNIGIGRDDRIGIVGENGAGKSTIVTGIVDALNESEVPEQWFYIPQELSVESRENLAQRIGQIPREQRGTMLASLSRLDSDPERVLASRCLSHGEAQKLIIAKAMTRDLSLLILDEPTNHLDLPAILELEKALRSFRGALCIVSHDTRFIGATCDTFWQVCNDTVDIGSCSLFVP